jgi:hypothetical protein
MGPAKMKHLEMILAVVARMASNSFLLKGWSITLVSALFAFAAKDGNAWFAAIGFFPALVFCGLDGYYLWQERLFRMLYDKVRLDKDPESDFSMATGSLVGGDASWWAAIKSDTVLYFHAVVFISVFIVVVALLVTHTCGGH